MTDNIGFVIGIVIGAIGFFAIKWYFIDRKKKSDDLLSQTQEVGSQWDYLKE